jgi:enoyl-CoA hydratase/carnithine racemase
VTTIDKPSTATHPAAATAEVITHAYTRVITVPSANAPGGSVTVALITLDNGRDHTRPSTLGPLGLASLDAAISIAVEAAPDAIAVTGKPFIFAVGADLSQVGMVADRAAAQEIGALGHRVFRRLGTSGIPTFAFVNGAAFGGGVELALHCDYRTLASNAAAVALPEVFLGILPGWGGTQLLPRIAGPENAVTVIIENALNQNRTMKPKDALRLGVVDIVLDAADFLEQSLAWLAGVLSGAVSVPARDFRAAPDEEWSAALERGKIIADMRTHGASPAPYRALEMIELSRTAALADGLAAERAALVDLIMTQEFRAGVPG